VTVEFLGPQIAELYARSGDEGPMVADANACRRDQDHNATLHTVYRTFGDVRPTSEVLELIRGSTS
jgi:hypothetical protein